MIAGESETNGIKSDVPLAEDETAFEDMEEESGPETPKKPALDVFLDHLRNLFLSCSDSMFGKFEKWIEKRWGPVEDRYFYNNTTEVIWTIDAYARKVFPIVFLILQITYWTSYLYLLTDE